MSLTASKFFYKYLSGSYFVPVKILDIKDVKSNDIFLPLGTLLSKKHVDR